MKHCLLAISLLAPAASAWGQAENPDFRIRAEFRDAQDESVGHADFRIKSRFQQVYYGGVTRKDEFRFDVELHSSQFANLGFNVLLNNFQVGTITANSLGFVEQAWRSRFSADDAPDLPLPAGFPQLVNTGDTVRIFNNATNDLVLTGILGEAFARGDVDQDGDVDSVDLAPWKSHYGTGGIGPVNGDFTGDNRADGADLLLWQQNASPSGGGGGGGGRGAAAVPEPDAVTLSALALAPLAKRRRQQA